VQAAAYLNMVRELPVVSLAELIGESPFLVISPHPDDESLGTGGLIASARSEGLDADVVLLTDGAESHPASTLFPRPRLVEVRRSEVVRAGRILGLLPDSLHQLDLPDTQVPNSGVLFGETVARLVSLVDRAKVKTVFVTWSRDPHCDHQSAAILANEIRLERPGLRLWAYPIWGWHLNASLEIDLPPPTGVRLDISDQQKTKRAAIDAHASQMTDLIPDDPNGFRFTERTLAPFLGPFEYFLEVPK
jgi:LmbE family N-acetylglucosaminyl deacetylase